MSRILITGGSGYLGRQLTPRLQKAGWTVRVLSRSPRPASIPAELEWAVGDAAANTGLAEALNGVDAVIHAASSPSDPELVDVGGARNLTAAFRETPVGHLLYISIVGIDAIPFSYYKAKLATENVVEASPVPWTILRATQFHSFVGDRILPGLARLPLLFVPTDIPLQLIDEGEVAQRLVELVSAGPTGRAEDIGGPEIKTFREIAQSWLKIKGSKQRIVHLPIPGKAAAAFRAGFHTTPDHIYGKITWNQWLERRNKES